MATSKNKLFYDSIWHSDTKFDIFVRASKRSTRLSVKVLKKNNLLVTLPFFISLEDFINSDEVKVKVLSLVNRLLKKIDKYEKISQMYSHIKFNYLDDNCQIIIFNQTIDLVWKFHLRHSNFGDFNLDFKSLIIYTNIKNQNNKLERKKIFLGVLKNILEKYLFEKQKYYATLMKLPFAKLNIVWKNTTWATHLKKTKGSKISYNLKLIALEKELIDYVIVHELSHYVHKNHNINFYNYATQFLSNFRELDKKINTIKVSI